MAGLRERRHAETKQAIVDAAFTLFERHGFSSTLMDDIAEHAGVSRSTLYRRYRSKDEIVLEVPLSWLAAWDEAIDSLEPEVPLDEAMSIGCEAVAATIDAESDRVLAAYAALAESPTLQASGASNRDWLERIAALLTSRSSDLDEPESLIIAGAYMGAIDMMMFAWAQAGGTTSAEEATTAVLKRLAPILPPG